MQENMVLFAFKDESQMKQNNTQIYIYVFACT